MPCNRREFIKKSMALTACSAAAHNLFAAQKGLSEPPVETFQDTLKRLFNHAKITETDKIAMQIPKIAENGAVVPVTITSTLSNVSAIFILVKKNPLPLSAKFTLAPELETTVSARLKMAETSDVMVIAETAEGFYSATELVKVTIGGCGG